jgi:hypothetical protein
MAIHWYGFTLELDLIVDSNPVLVDGSFASTSRSDYSLVYQHLSIWLAPLILLLVPSDHFTCTRRMEWTFRRGRRIHPIPYYRLANLSCWGICLNRCRVLESWLDLWGEQYTFFTPDFCVSNQTHSLLIITGFMRHLPINHSYLQDIQNNWKYDYIC